jgi:hypothetical protein
MGPANVLQVASGDLLRFYCNVFLLSDQLRMHTARVPQQLSRVPHRNYTPFFSPIVGLVINIRTS